VPAAAPAYYVVESNGGVHNYGGAGFYGSKAPQHHLPAPVVGGAATADGGGYWIVTKKGNIYNFGDATFYGSPVHQRLRGPVVAITATPDGQGYWIATSSGSVYNYGDAAFCGSAVHNHLRSSIAGLVPTPDGEGYWLFAQNGSIYNFGDAEFFGSGAKYHTRVAVVGMGTTTDALGYWLAYANGSVRNFGDARFYGSAVHRRLPKPIVSFASTPDALGYWITGASGRVYNFGDARFYGSLAHHPPPRSVRVVAIVATFAVPVAAVAPYPHGALGYDISDFQCSKTGSPNAKFGLPPSSGISIIQVVGWLDSAQNSCLSSEVAWATRAGGANGAPYNLYIFMNSPGTTPAAAAASASGPAGRCATLSAGASESCSAYNYGFNGARSALEYAISQGVHSSIWWLDIENDSLSPNANSSFSAGRYWSDSTALNDQTIQGALDALRRGGITVGIYSTSVQYPKIAGDFVPRGPRIPLWVAGVPWTRPPFVQRGLPGPGVLGPWCTGTATYPKSSSVAVFAGGVPWLLQETPGNLSSPYGLDPDYAC